jgi:hypothetical protein
MYDGYTVSPVIVAGGLPKLVILNTTRTLYTVASRIVSTLSTLPTTARPERFLQK